MTTKSELIKLGELCERLESEGAEIIRAEFNDLFGSQIKLHAPTLPEAVWVRGTFQQRVGPYREVSYSEGSTVIFWLEGADGMRNAHGEVKRE